MKFAKHALAVAAAVTLPAVAQAGPFQFSDTVLGGTNTFQFSSLVISGQGTSTVTITDGGLSPGSANGVLDPIGSSTDSFVETGTVFGASFKNIVGGSEVGVPAGVSGLTVNYELYAVYTPPAGVLAGVAGVNGTDAVAFFSGAYFTLYYDDVVDGLFTGGSTAIGSGSNGTGNCVLPGYGIAQGTCELNFDFNALAGIFSVVGGNDFMDYDRRSVNLDINVDEVSPAFSPVFGPSGVQVVEIDHDGSARFSVPEPGSLALLSGALMGLAAFGRRRSA
ncbi:MAG: flocculation-associated PEP-CTERM protein PepA [Moraxellaceae bacterium]|nr:flocculation-associated PEP-CTERM protein PepA [Moraxellaceae bacterium]